MLERRRQSTAAIVQRQLQNVQVSESVAGQKVIFTFLNPAPMDPPSCFITEWQEVQSGKIYGSAQVEESAAI